MSIQNNKLPDNPNIEVIKAKETGLFTNYIFKAIPLAFDESMSYYETLCGLLNYLQNTILPTLNNNADAVSELQNLYIELKTYVDNYFTNLDVQEEINNKLDEMVSDNTLQNILNNNLLASINKQLIEQATSIDNINNNLSNTIKTDSTGQITEKMLSQELKQQITGGSVAVVGINSVSNINIQDNIDYLNLNNELNNFISKEKISIELSQSFQGFPYNNNNVLDFNTTVTNVEYYIVNLTKNNIYEFIGYNAYSIRGLFITDNQNNIIYQSGNSNVEGYKQTKYIFRANQDNLRAYITKYTTASSIPQFILNHVLFNQINYNKLNYKFNNKIELVESVTGKFLSANSIIGNLPYFQDSEQTNYNIYRLKKGEQYIVKSHNAYLNSGIGILDEQFKLIYLSSNANYNGVQYFQYEFTAKDNGYIILSSQKASSFQFNGTIELKNTSNILEYKNIYFDGDSVCAGYGNNNISYDDMIANNNKMNLTKLAVSGTTLSKVKENSILQRIQNNSTNAYLYDYVIIEGGLNDIFQNVPLGNITNGYTNEFDELTFSGALESLCKTLVTNYNNSKIGFILTNQKVNNYRELQDTYWSRAEEIFKKWSVPYINLATVSGCLPLTDELLNKYFFIPSGSSVGDGTHPNKLGYERYFNKQITEFIKTL